MKDYSWLEKRTPRSVDQLKLWPVNPRLDPEEKHNSISDYASDLIVDNGEKRGFLQLVGSIATKGFIPSDPIVVWKDPDDGKFYVAEGNRRVLALKLLRNPEKAPRSIQSFIRKQAALIDRDTIEKVNVVVAPDFNSCAWYINQRHASSSMQRPWSRLQQQRWIAEIYDHYNGEVEEVSEITGLTKSQLEYTLRILKVRDMALLPEVLSQLSPQDQERVKSHRIPMTILERWFTSAKVKEAWGYRFFEDNIIINSDRKSFLNAYAELIKRIFNKEDYTNPVDTRTITANLDNILNDLPKVLKEGENKNEVGNNGNNSNNDNNDKKDKKEENNKDQSKGDGNKDGQKDTPPPKKPIDKNPDRSKIIAPNYSIRTDNYKLSALFNEMKRLPIKRNGYPNTAAATLRIFLDLAVHDHIKSNNFAEALSAKYHNKDLFSINLKQKLEFLKQNLGSGEHQKVIARLLANGNHYSLDTLNEYIHGDKVHNTNHQFLNGFWDMLLPLITKLVDVRNQ